MNAARGSWTAAGTDAEVPMGGGRTSIGVVRIGDAVHRPVRPWTAAVHEVLRHLERAGFSAAPRVVGVDEQGREVLSYLEGETVGERRPWPAWVHEEAALPQVGAWLRRLHDTTADFVPPAGAVWFAGQTWRPGHVIGHHDAAPYNAVWRDGRLAGFVDWDTAGPSSRELDLAFAALFWVPLLAPGSSSWPHASAAAGNRKERLHLLLDGYGYEGDRRELGAVVAARARINATVLQQRIAAGDPAFLAIRHQADDLESSARWVEALPDSFWDPAPPG